LKNRYLQAFQAYSELIHSGGIQSIAEGENVFLDIRGNITGDILLFIVPKKKIAADDKDIMELIRSDKTLEHERRVVIESFRQKFKGLSLLPESLVWVLGICFSILYTYWNFDNILTLFSGKWGVSEILSLLPLLLLSVITPLLGKYVGFNLLKPILAFISLMKRLFRLIRNRKVEESPG